MKKILIVDDYESITEALQLALQDEFEVITVNTAEEALETISDFKPEILLTDNKLPEMNGLDLLNHLVDKPYPKRKIIISAYLSEGEAVIALALGVECYLVKPFSISRLKGIINRFPQR